MPIAVGESIPAVTLFEIGEAGPAPVASGDVFGGKKIALFGVPGAYTPTCQNKHMPSYIGQMDALKAKGVDEVVCVSVNDPFVMEAWGKSTGADEGGLTLLADADGAYTAAVGMGFDAPPVGFKGRSLRYAMVVDDGVVTVFQAEESPGVCGVSSGNGILEAL